MPFKNAIIGGTFDHLHHGHKYFIDKAFKNSEFVTIGVTVDAFSIGKELSYLIESFETRKNEVYQYLKNKRYESRANIIPIKDIYGTSLTDKNIDAIFTDVSGFVNAQKINEERKKIGFPELKIVKNEYIKDDEGEVLSSTKIRKGHENREGMVYSKSFSVSEILRLPIELRNNLRKPFGKIVKKLEKGTFENKFVIAVGDIAVSKLYETGAKPNISIYDFKTVRNKISDKKILKFLPKENIIIDNPQGTIAKEAVAVLKKAIDGFEKGLTTNIKVIGEEDLLALPAMLLSPLKTMVVYGIRDKGAVVVEVSENLKEELSKDYIQKFIRI